MGQIGHRALRSEIDFAGRYRCYMVVGPTQVGIYNNISAPHNPHLCVVFDSVRTVARLSGIPVDVFVGQQHPWARNLPYSG